MFGLSADQATSTFDDSCVLMFSGGRDSTLAAIRLLKSGFKLTLVTVSSDHLFGREAVRQRLREMKSLLPPETKWLTVKQPRELHTDISFYEQTCLPCHHAYTLTGAKVALATGAKTLSFGYAGYQNDWPEQTPLAVGRLTHTLSAMGIELILPVYDLESRESAVDQLCVLGLSSASLEQKCSRQITNVKLDEHKLHEQISLWESAIRASAANLAAIDISIIESTTVGNL